MSSEPVPLNEGQGWRLRVARQALYAILDAVPEAEIGAPTPDFKALHVNFKPEQTDDAIVSLVDGIKARGIKRFAVLEDTHGPNSPPMVSVHGPRVALRLVEQCHVTSDSRLMRFDVLGAP